MSKPHGLHAEMAVLRGVVGSCERRRGSAGGG